MADTENLTEQEIAEGEENEPVVAARSGRGGKGILLFGIVVAVEAVLLFIGFSMIHKKPTMATASISESAMAEDAQAGNAQRVIDEWRWSKVDLDRIHIFNEDASNSRAEKRYSARFVIWMDQASADKLATTEGGDAANSPLEYVKLQMRRIIIEEMRTYGVQLKNDEVRRRFPERVRKELSENKELRKYGVEIFKVFMEDFKTQRY